MPVAPRRESGYRDYGPRDLHSLHFIGRDRDLGFSIDEIRKLLELWHDRTRASADVNAVALARAAELKRKESELHAMRRSLEHLAASCQGDERPECPIIDDLETSDLATLVQPSKHASEDEVERSG